MNKLGANITEILVVEDEPQICQVCVRALTSEGFKVDIAVNGEVAEGMLEQKVYDLVLIDIRTPVLNGKELYEWMEKKHPEMASNVIFTTGDVISKDTQYFLERTTRPFIPKPFTPIELRTAIKETLEELKAE